MLGKWLSCRGWAEAMQECRHKAWLAASHLTRTPHVLMCKGYEEYVAKVDGNELVKLFQEWKEHATKVPAVFVLGGVLDLQLCCLQLVRAVREANFSTYIKALKQI